MGRRDDAIAAAEQFTFARRPGLGPTCGECKDVECHCSKGSIPAYAQQPACEVEPKHPALIELRVVVAVFHNLPFGNPVPRALVDALNRAEDLLQKIDPVPF